MLGVCQVPCNFDGRCQLLGDLIRVRQCSVVRFWFSGSPAGNRLIGVESFLRRIKAVSREGIKTLRRGLPRQPCDLFKPVLFFHALYPLPDSRRQLD
jgi:hypothetical protein